MGGAMPLRLKAGGGLKFNEHIEADGPTVLAHACKIGLEGIVSKRRLRLPFRPLARLAQNEKRGCTCGETGGRGRLGPMTEGKNRIMIFGPNPDQMRRAIRCTRPRPVWAIFVTDCGATREFEGAYSRRES
jgi:hypothetical protein